MRHDRDRYAMVLPTDLLNRYESNLSDPNQLSLSNEIALLDTRVSSLLESIEGSGSAASWKRVQAAWDIFMAAYDSDSIEGVITATDKVIRTSIEDYRRWHEIVSLIEMRRKLVESEQRRLISNRQFIAVEQVIAMLDLTIESVKRVVGKYVDEDDAKLIVYEAAEIYRQLIGSEESDGSGAIVVDARNYTK